MLNVKMAADSKPVRGILKNSTSFEQAQEAAHDELVVLIFLQNTDNFSGTAIYLTAFVQSVLMHNSLLQ